MTRTVVAFEFSDCGVNYVQYFSGVGVAYTDWDEVFLGAGDTAKDAAEDAVESMCCTASVGPGEVAIRLDFAIEKMDDNDSAHDECVGAGDDAADEDDESHSECELYHYVALFVKYANERVEFTDGREVPGMGPECIPCTAAGHMYCDCHAYCGETCKVVTE